MGESLDLELDYIRGLVEGIRDHWEFLNTPYHPLGFEPAAFYHRWLEDYFGDGWLAEEAARRRCLEDAGRGLEIAQLIPALEGMSYGQVPAAVDAEFINGSFRKHSAWAAHKLAVKAVCEPLDDAELNELSWRLTDLVARGDGPLREALSRAARSAGQKGGRNSAASRRADFESAVATTCQLAKTLLMERDRTPADLVSVLVKRLGRTAPTVREHLRAGGLYPEKKKRKSS